MACEGLASWSAPPLPATARAHRPFTPATTAAIRPHMPVKQLLPEHLTHGSTRQCGCVRQPEPFCLGRRRHASQARVASMHTSIA